jgi:hypothetical protein
MVSNNFRFFFIERGIVPFGVIARLAGLLVFANVFIGGYGQPDYRITRK